MGKTRERIINESMETLKIIKRYQMEYGYTPSYRDLVKELGLASTSAIPSKINYLELEGYITRPDQRMARVIILTDKGREALQEWQ